jgi:arginase family enzyme
MARTVESRRTYHVLGVPLRSGSLYPGTENDAQAYRDARLVERLREAGRDAVDDGDVAVPSYLPHHSIPPIRSWPGPRIVWDCVSERLAPYLAQPGHVPLLIGCDCSVVVGTTQALARAVPGADVHVLYLDGDFDDAPPTADRCRSAAASAVWLLTQPSPFWSGPALAPGQVTVVGWTTPSESPPGGPASLPLAELRTAGVREAARATLQRIPGSAAIVVHLDVDVLQQRDMPAAYFPHREGLTLDEAAELLPLLLGDTRVRIIEVSELAALRDVDRRCARAVVELLAASLRP